MEIELRPYQQKCVDIINNMKNGSHLVQMATGLGKTVTFASIKRQGRVLILSLSGYGVTVQQVKVKLNT